MKSFDCKKIQNSPFTTKLTYPSVASDCSAKPTDNITQETFQRMCESYKYDTFKLYPQNYLIDEDKVYFTQEGDWNSLREQKHCCNRETNKTYYMNIKKNND